MSGSWSSGHGTRTRITVRVARSTTVVSSRVEERTSRCRVEPPDVGIHSLRRAERRSSRAGIGRGRGVAPDRARAATACPCPSGLVPRLRCRRPSHLGFQTRDPLRGSSPAASRLRPYRVLPSSDPSLRGRRCRGCPVRIGRIGRIVERHTATSSSCPARVGTSAAGMRHDRAWQTKARPGSAGRSSEERAVIGLAPGHHGSGEPPPAYLGQQVGAVTRDDDLVSARSTGGAPPPGRAGRPDAARAAGGASSMRPLRLQRRDEDRRASALTRSRAETATELVEGSAPSRNSLGRTTRVSASLPGGEEAAGLLVPEEVEQLVHRLPCALAPQRLAGPLREPQAGLGQPGVVCGDGQVASTPALPAAHQPRPRHTSRTRGTRRSLRPAGRSGRCRWPLPLRPALPPPWRSTR